MEPKFTELLADVFKFRFTYITARDKKGHLQGVMPCFFLKNVFFGKRLVSLPFNFFGGCAATTPHALNNILEQVKRLSSPCLYCEIKNTELLSPEVAKRYNLLLNRQFLTYVLPLSSQQELEKGLKKRFREKLRSLKLKYGSRLTLKRGTKESDLVSFYSLMVKEYLRKHLMVPLPFKFFSKFWEVFISKKSADLFLLYFDHHLAAGVIVLYYKKKMIYQWGAFNLNLAWASPLTLLLDQMLYLGLEQGLEVFDFGLTEKNHQGLRFFKSRWGTEEKWLSYYYLLSRTEKISPPDYHSSFLTARQILPWLPVFFGKRLPPWVIRQLA